MLGRNIHECCLEVKEGKSDENKHHEITYIWNLKYDTNKLIYKTEMYKTQIYGYMELIQYLIIVHGKNMKKNINNLIILLYTKNKHNTANQLCFNKIHKFTHTYKVFGISIDGF